MTLYRYVGPPAIAEHVRTAPGGCIVGRSADVEAWLRETRQEIRGGLVIAAWHGARRS